MSFKSLSLAICLLCVCLTTGLAQQRAGLLRGQVTDELGGLVVGATVTLVAADGTQRTATTNNEGVYTFNGIAPGAYTLRVAASGFSPYETADITVAAGPRTTHDVRLVVGIEKQVITVTEEQALNVDPAGNSDAVVLKGQDLDVLPDDPDALASAVQAMAGPSAGPNGGQIFIDGFTGGRMPPKESIREVRVNQNPFNAENSGIGFGQIEIFTKPGADKLRGSTFYNFGDESLNSRNPFAPERAPFQVRYFGGSLSGPVTKGKSSFFIDFQRRAIDDNAIINATVLDSNFAATPFNVALLTPTHFFSFSPRFDYQLNQANTLVMRYSYTRTHAENVGANGFSLPERAFDRSNTFQNVQITETAILSPALMNETRFQYSRARAQQDGNNEIPTIVVQESFTSGGSAIGLAHNDEDRWELQNYWTWTKGRHILRFGARVRGVHITDFSPQNFGGTFNFSGGDAPQLDANNQIVRDAHGDPVLIPRRRHTVFNCRRQSGSEGEPDRSRHVSPGRVAAAAEPDADDGHALREPDEHQQQLQLCAASVLRVGAGWNERGWRPGRAGVELFAKDGDSRRHGRLLRSLQRTSDFDRESF
jgi:hypothetical protein